MARTLVHFTYMGWRPVCERHLAGYVEHGYEIGPEADDHDDRACLDCEDERKTKEAA